MPGRAPGKPKNQHAGAGPSLALLGVPSAKGASFRVGARLRQVKLCFHTGCFERCSGSQWKGGQILKFRGSWRNGVRRFHTAVVISWRA